ncbi:MAG: 3D domain-containing protein [Desulfitobacteriaceae bacterium]
MVGILTIALFILIPKAVIAPELPQQPQVQDLGQSVAHTEITTKSLASRGAPTQRIEKRVMKVTAYTKRDAGMNGKGITTSGQPVQEGITIADPPEIPLGSQIYIPTLGKTYTVTDRGGAIKGDRLDLYFEDRGKALEFGVQDLEVYIRIENL